MKYATFAAEKQIMVLVFPDNVSHSMVSVEGGIRLTAGFFNHESVIIAEEDIETRLPLSLANRGIGPVPAFDAAVLNNAWQYGESTWGFVEQHNLWKDSLLRLQAMRRSTPFDQWSERLPDHLRLIRALDTASLA